jgi:ferrous iron transport protein A
MTETLRTLEVGEAGRVAGFAPGRRSYRRRLLAMGLTPGVPFEVTRCAPMGDPVEIRLRGFSLSLRREEAEALQIDRGQA